MEMTCDVSKFSGQLKVGEKESRRLQGSGAAELMLNIPLMDVTLDVSKLSVWLRLTSPCAEPHGGHLYTGRGAGLNQVGGYVRRGSRSAGRGAGCGSE